MLSIWLRWSEVVSSFSVVQMHVWFHEASFGLQGAPQLCLTMLQAIDFPIFHREPAKLQTKKSTLKSKRTISTILYKAAPQDQDHTHKQKQQTSNKRHLRYFPFLAKPTRFSSPQYPNKIMASFQWHCHSSHWRHLKAGSTIVAAAIPPEQRRRHHCTASAVDRTCGGTRGIDSPPSTHCDSSCSTATEGH